MSTRSQQHTYREERPPQASAIPVTVKITSACRLRATLHFLPMSPEKSEEITIEKWPDRMTQGTKNTAKPLRLPPGESIQARRCDPAGKNKKPKKYGYLRPE